MAIVRNNNIGLMLKQYRKACGLTVRDVCDILNSQYNAEIADKTVYGWESNQAHPTADMLLILCDLYGITNLTGMQEKPYRRTVIPTLEEEALILAYRKAKLYQPAIQALLAPFLPKPWPHVYPDDTRNRL